MKRAANQRARCDGAVALACVLIGGALFARLAGTARADEPQVRVEAIALAGTGAAGFGVPIAGAGGSVGRTSTLPLVLNADAPIPGDGGILISGPVQPSVTIIAASDTASTAIVGTLSPLHSNWVWIPTTPLAAGEYTVTTVANGSTVVTNLTMIEPATYEPPEISMSATLSRSQVSATTDCCRSWSFGQQFSTSCFEVSAQGHAIVGIALSSEAPPEQVGQFVFQARPNLGATAAPALVSVPVSAPLQVIFSEQAEQYCFNVEAIDIVTATVAAYDDFAPACIPHGELGDVGLHQHDLAGLGLLDAARCELPPFGFEDSWCEHNESTCTADGAPRYCRSYAHVCDGAPVPADTTPLDALVAGSGGAGSPPVGARGGVGGIGGTGGMSAGSDGEAGTGGETGEAGMGDSDGGGGGGSCHVSGLARTRARSSMLATLAPWLAALVLAARRRSRKR